MVAEARIGVGYKVESFRADILIRGEVRRLNYT